MERATACSFCGTPIAEVKQIFENEDLSSAICGGCVASFAQNLVDSEDETEA